MSNASILLVEDNPDDVLLIQRAFHKAALPVEFSFAADGEEAIVFLSALHLNPVPALVLLDLKLPRKSGLEVLEWAKTRDDLRRIPIVVLTSSRENRDLNRAYDLGANSYLIKPVQFDALLELMRRVHLYWLVSNEVPARGVAG